MRTPQALRFTPVLGGVAAAWLVAGCASAPPAAERYVPPPLGSSWTYEVSSTGSFGSGKAVSTVRLAQATWNGRTLLKFETAQGSLLQTDKAGAVAILGPAGRTLMAYEPPLGIEWPLAVAKTWVQDIVLTAPDGSKVPMKANWKVEAYEDVTVPAGMFKAWKITMGDNFGFTQTIWSVPEKLGVFVKRIQVRSATHPQGGAGSQVQELASAPAIR